MLKLMYAALIRASESWRGVRIKPLERKQLQVVGEELDAEFWKAHEQPPAKIEVVSPSTKSSKNRTRPAVVLGVDEFTVDNLDEVSLELGLPMRSDRDRGG